MSVENFCQLDKPLEKERFITRHACESDIDAINELLRIEWGNDHRYFVTNEMLQSKRSVYIVAVDSADSDKIIGFAQARPLFKNPQIYMNANFIIAPKYRSREYRLGDRLAKARIAEVKAKGALALCAESLCRTGDAPQRNQKRNKFLFVGLEPGRAPGMAVTESQCGLSLNKAASAAFVYLPLHEDCTFQFSHKIFLPQDYWALLEEHSQFTNLQRRIQDLPVWDGNVQAPKHIEPKCMTSDGKELHGSQFVDININNQVALDTITKFRSEGWIFSCFLPSYGYDKKTMKNFDVLRMCRPVEAVDFDQIPVVEDLYVMRDFMKAEYIGAKANH